MNRLDQRQRHFRNAFFFAVLALLSAAMGFAYTYHIPQLKNWMLFQLADFSQSNGPVYIFADDVEFTIFPVGVDFHHIRLIAKGSLKKDFQTISIDHVSASIDPLRLLAGRFGLSEVRIRRPKVRARIAESKSHVTRPKMPQVDLPLKRMMQFPVRKLKIEDMSIAVDLPESGLTLTGENIELDIVNRAKSILVTLLAPNIIVNRTEKGDVPEAFDLTTRFQITEQQAKLLSFKIQKGDAFVTAVATATGDIAKLNLKSTEAEASTHLTLEHTREWIHTFFPDIKIPPVQGGVDFKTNLALAGQKLSHANGELKTADLKVDGFEIGTIETHWSFKDDVFISPVVKLQSLAGTAELKNVRLELNEEHRLSGLVDVQKFGLRQLLRQLAVGDIPVELDVNGQLPCEGTLNPISVDCTGVLNGTNLLVFNPDNKKTIVAAKRFSANGKVKITDTGVFPRADLTVGESKGSAEGEVYYATGFRFKYQTPQLNFSDILNLANLKFEGAMNIQGTTEGNSDAATLNMRVDGKDVWFEDYGIGSISTNVSYKKNILTLANVDGLFRTSHYKGDLSIDLHNEALEAQAQFPYLEVNDLQRLFERKVKLPFVAIGSGNGEVTVKGPLEFNRLSYVVRSSIFNGTVADEKFSEAHFDVTATDGHVVTDRVQMKKQRGIANLKGKGEPDGQIATIIEGRNFLLQDSETLARLGLTLSGNLDFDMSLKGHVLSPDTFLRGTVTRSFIGQEAVSDSNFDINFTKSDISGTGNLLGNDVFLDFSLPLTDAAPFRWKLKTQKWNFAPLFALIAPELNAREYETSLTTNMSLEAPKGGFWKSTGFIDIANIRIRKGSLEMFSNEMLHAQFRNGILNIPPWTLQGDNTLLKLEAQNSTQENLNVSLNGRVELNLLSFLTPFFSELRGSLSLVAQINGSSHDPRLIGSAYLEKGFAKLPALPHAFEDIKTDVLFSKDQLMVNSIECGFAGGRILGDGSIQLKGFRNFPTDLRGHFDNVNLNIPAGIATQGGGDFHVTGNWFPFTFTANYNISDGLVTKTFEEEEVTGQTLKRATLLPTFLAQKEFTALNLNIKTSFLNGVKVKNPTLDAELVGDLQIKGTTNSPLLSGDISARKGGKLYFRDTPFEIGAATIKFNNPRENNPVIYITGSAQIKEYDVSLLAQGTAKNLQLNLRSQPPLPDQDIISLLALGVTSTDLEKLQSGTQIDRQGYEIGSAIISSNPLGKEIKKRTGFDVKFQSSIDQTDNAAVPKIIISKQWTPKVNTSASRSIGNKVSQDVKLEYHLNNNVSVIGSWEGKTFAEETGVTNTQEYFGLDLQYKVEFK